MTSSSDEREAMEAASKIAQIFSGAMFSALCVYLVMSNSTRVSYIQKASLEKRLNVCCQINTIVAALSAFLNWFQLTEVDNFALKGGRSMVVDVARPVEWILTCPLMQLSLVLMGGSRIPEYRRTLMPSLSAIVLCLGALTLFLEQPGVSIVWLIAVCFHITQMFFNFKQVQEHSNGVESLFQGDSEFRKATIVLMATWLPFPAWYLLSPEGFGAVDNIVIIQLGWAFLNVTAKFSLIFYMQRVKDNYCNRLKVKREMKGALANAYATDADEEDSCDGGNSRLHGELSACVVETMSDLGMAYNVERFQTLLREAGICSLDQIESLTQDTCAEAQLPWDLVSALKKRYKVWALEMVDQAERGLEAGERHYKKSILKKSRLQSDGSSMFLDVNNSAHPLEGIAMPNKDGASNEMGFTGVGADGGQIHAFGMQQPTYGTCDPQAIREAVKPLEKKLDMLESQMSDKFELAIENIGRRFESQMEKYMEKTHDKFGSGLRDMRSLVECSQSAIESKVEFILFSQQKAHSQTIEADMKKQFDELTEKLLLQARVSQDEGSAQLAQAVEQSMSQVSQGVEQSTAAVNRKTDEFQESLKGAISRLGGSITQMMDGWAQHTIQESKATAFTLQTKMSQFDEAQMQRVVEIEQNIASKIHKVVGEGMDGIANTVTMQAKSSVDQLQASIEATKTVASGTHSELESKLVQMVKELNNDFSKNIELGLGVVGNSLRAQLEGLQASQLSHHQNTESTISMKVDSKLTSMKQGLTTEAQQLAAQAQAHQAQTQKQLEKHTEKITTVLASANEAARGHRNATEEMHSTIRDVRAGTDECVDRFAGLYDHLGVSGEPSRVPNPRAPLNRGGSASYSRGPTR